MASIWEKDTAFPVRERLNEDLDIDIAVIGGGMAGILTAYLLQEKGMRAAVFEARRVGSGQTGRTTAKITSQHGMIYTDLIRRFGEQKARQYAQANERAIAEYFRIVKQEGIDCMLEEQPAYLYSTKGESALETEYKAAVALGLRAEYVKQTGLPFAVQGALRFDGQAQFHPLRFLRALSEKVRVYENTEVLRVENNTLITGNGVVRARKIVVATHYPFINTPGYYFMRMHQERSYVVALENAAPLNGMYYGIDKDEYSLRYVPKQAPDTGGSADGEPHGCGDLTGPDTAAASGDGPLPAVSAADGEPHGWVLLGGGSHRTGENTAGGKYEDLRAAARQLFPGSREAAHWSAQDCITVDGMPYIGLYSASTPDLYVATGFHKWGMTGSMASAISLCELIVKNRHPYELFSPQRLKISASAKALWEEGRHSVKGLSTEFLTLPVEKAAEVPRGHGGIVEFQKQKIGVYKAHDGTVYVVSTRCPHLGCQLEWNPDELTWDCPCHGSRFDFEGKRLEGPAMKNIDE